VSPTSSVRVDAMQALVDALNERLAGTDADALYGMQATFPTRGILVLGVPTGTMQLSRLMGGRKRRNDEFSIHCWIMATAPGESAKEADESALELFNHLDGYLAEHAGVSTSGITWAGLEQVDGPFAVPATEGFTSYMDAFVKCHAELS
jgi:hypothetical protein